MDSYKVVFVHGFSEEEVTRIMRGVKSVVEDPGSIAFCTSTKQNLKWKVKNLIDHVTKEHDYMKNLPKKKE